MKLQAVRALTGCAVFIILGGTLFAQAPRINTGGVVNSASFSSSSIAAGSIVSVFGSNLAVSTLTWAGFPLQTTLVGTQVIINGFAAPLFFVSPEQINAQVPWELASSATFTVQVSVFGEISNSVVVAGRSASPGIYRVAEIGGSQGAVLLPAAEFAAPRGSFPGARPARRGEFIAIYCTGLGTVSSQPGTGAPANTGPLSPTTQVPTVTIGNAPATVSYSGLAPSFVGLYQVNVQIPANAISGNAVPVVLTMGSSVSNTVTIAVE